MATKKKRGGRGGGAPGTASKTWEGRQSKVAAKTGTDALKKAKGQPMGKQWARNAMNAAEKKMSISASKYRERHRSKSRKK